MGALLLSLILTQAAAEPVERFPFNVELQPVYEQAFGQLEKGQFEAALPDAQRLVREAADNPRAWRLLGMVELEQKPAEAEQAFQKALELGIDGKRRADVLAGLASLAMPTLSRRREVERWLDESLKLDPDGLQALYLSATLLNSQGNLGRARERVEHLLQLQPDVGSAHALRAAILANQGEDEAAAEEVAIARGHGVQAPFFDELEERARDSRRTYLLWWSLPAMVVFVLGSLGLLFVAGSLLSRIQVHRLASVDAHLLRDEQTPLERWIGRLYNLVLWYGSALFYISVPVTLVVSLATGAAMIYGLFLLPRVSIQLILVALVVALGGIWSILRGLFVSGPSGEGGRVLAEAEAPRLFAALAEVAEVAKARRVDKVYLDPDAGIGVREAGGTWKVLLGGGERILHLGFAALKDVSISELKGILAHEYGHFSHGETRLTPVIARILASVLRTLQEMVELGRSTYLNPVYWYLRMYLAVYLGVTRGHSRRRELLADRSAALAYGGDAFAAALNKAIRNGELFDRSGVGTLLMFRKMGRPCRNLYRCLDAADGQTPLSLRELRVRELVERKEEKYDSHPPPHERISRVAGIAAQRSVEDAPALTLFEQPEALAEELTQHLWQKVEQYLRARGAELPAVRSEVAPAQQEQIAGAVAFYQDALELRERTHPEADRVLIASAQRLGEVMGPDPLLVPALQEMAQAQHRMGDLSAARASFERAIGILESEPVKNQAWIDSLQRQLEVVMKKAA